MLHGQCLIHFLQLLASMLLSVKPMACSCPGLVAQLVEGREFKSHPGQSFSLPLCWSISLPGANTQIGQLGNFSALQFTLKKKQNKTKQKQKLLNSKVSSLYAYCYSIILTS